jgi:hypothetical protein
MSGPGTAACRRHRPELLVLLEDPLGRALDPAARAHLDACATCREEIGGLVLAGRLIERVLAAPADAAPADAAPGADSWPRLRARIARRPVRLGRAASPILGLAMGAGLAVALLLPIGAMRYQAADVSTAPAVFHEAGLDPDAIIAAGLRDAEEEARWLRAMALAGKEAAGQEMSNTAREALIRMETALEPDLNTRAPRSSAASVE